MEIDNKKLFLASCIVSLDDFLKTEISEGTHIHCSFTKHRLDSFIKLSLDTRKVKSISFSDGDTLYPATPEKEHEKAEF